MQHVEVARSLLNALPWFAWVALAAIVCGGATSMVQAIATHRERMAMIRCGMDPDAPHRKPVYENSEV